LEFKSPSAVPAAAKAIAEDKGAIDTRDAISSAWAHRGPTPTIESAIFPRAGRGNVSRRGESLALMRSCASTTVTRNAQDRRDNSRPSWALQRDEVDEAAREREADQSPADVSGLPQGALVQHLQPVQGEIRGALAFQGAGVGISHPIRSRRPHLGRGPCACPPREEISVGPDR
jgi:hypothetical protein